MRLCTFSSGAGDKVGALRGDKVVEVKAVSILEALRYGDAGSLEFGPREFALGEVALRAPIPSPGKIVAAIVNTQGMLGGGDVSLGWPRLDMKAPSSVIGPGETIVAPRSGVRPEVELAAVIGRTMGGGTAADAKEAIFGYTVLNDVTSPKDSKDDAYEAYRRDRGTKEIRKMTMRGPLFRSKNHDTFCPMGPHIVTSDELGGTGALRMTTKFDGELVQEGSTSEYIFTPEEIVSYVSGFLTLHPGDVVSCGSVGWATEALKDLDPTEYVLPRPTGSLELEIERVGSLRNSLSTERA